MPLLDPVPDADRPALPIAPIERVPAPDRERFIRDFQHRARPVILTGLIDDWPVDAWTPARIGADYADAQVVAARLENGTLFDDPTEGVVFHHVRLGEYVAALARPGYAGDYVMTPISKMPARFHDRYRVPSYCDGASHLRGKLWVGKAGTVTPLHRDVPHNLSIHLAGRKRWLLFPPSDSPNLYSRGLFSGMPNFSEVDPARPDFTRHPRLRDTHAMGATVGPGETLFIPVGWWHHTETLEDAVAMNFWWGGRLVSLASFASTAFKRLRGIRRIEWG